MPLALSGTPLILLLVSLSTGRHISSNKCFTTHCLFVCCWRFFFAEQRVSVWYRHAICAHLCTNEQDYTTTRALCVCFFICSSSPVSERHQFADKLRVTSLYVDRSLMLCYYPLFVYFVPLNDPDSPWNDCKGLCQKGHLHLKTMPN